MTKHFFTMMLLVFAALTLTSCSEDDPTPNYTYFKPCTNWKATATDVRSYMAASAGFAETMSQGNLIFFKNESTQTSIIYAFHNGELVASIVTVSGFNDCYNDFKNQISTNYGITFNSTTLIDWGLNPQLMLNVVMHRFSTYMTAAYIDIDFLHLLEIDSADIEAIQALIDKIKAGLMPSSEQ